MELAAEREEVSALRERFTNLSERRACELVGIQRSSYRYQAKRSVANEALQELLRELSSEQPRYGYRRLGILLRREQTEAIHEKRIRRLYREAGWALRKWRRKKCKREAVPQVRLQKENQEWAMDFVEDSAANGQKLRFLAVIDQFTRECLCLAVDTSMPSARVIRELETVFAVCGQLQRLRMDNGSEFTSRLFLSWCATEQIEMVPIRPGKPVENAHSESFNGRLRGEFLNMTVFRNLWDARGKAAIWRKHHNQYRPHSSLD